MKSICFDININAPKKKVWEIMLDSESYKVWTSVFSEGSYFEGSWNKGERIKFLIPSGDGMISEIAECKPHEYISIKHLGQIKNGVEDFDSDEVKSWSPAFENYSFSEKDGITNVKVDMNATSEFEDFLMNTWPKALTTLKEICEV